MIAVKLTILSSFSEHQPILNGDLITYTQHQYACTPTWHKPAWLIQPQALPVLKHNSSKALRQKMAPCL